MNKQEREQLIDNFLIYLNDQVESAGQPIGVVWFNFQESEDKWNDEYLRELGVDLEQFQKILNVCLSRGYLKHSFNTRLREGIHLTEEGQGRAISADAAKRNPNQAGLAGDIHIATVNANGVTQIGHGNVQNVENVIHSWLEQIDAANASVQEKKEAKGLLSKFLEHPLVNTTLGIAGSFTSQVLGGQ